MTNNLPSSVNTHSPISTFYSFEVRDILSIHIRYEGQFIEFDQLCEINGSFGEVPKHNSAAFPIQTNVIFISRTELRYTLQV